MVTTAFAILIVSASTLAYEIVLMRIFSITHWHHLAYMVISIALLGFGASGTLLSLLQKPVRKSPNIFLLLSSFLFSVSMPICLLISQTVPFNLFLLIRDAHQFLNLLCYYLIFFVPFFFAAACVGIALLKYGNAIPVLYGANLLGSGLGSLAAIGLLCLLSPTDAAKAVTVLSLAATLLIAGNLRRSRLLTAVIVFPFLILSIVFPPVELRVSEYKTLSLVHGSVGTRILHTESGPLARIDVVEGPAIKFNPAPGLSFAFQGEPPPVRGILVDADSLTVMTNFGDTLENARYLDYTPQALPYHLLQEPKVAVLGCGGGSGVLLALLHRAESIAAVELNPAILRLVRNRYRRFSGGIYSMAQVKPVAMDGRGFIQSSDQAFDLIDIALLGSFGASAAGVYALSEDYLHTVEGFEAYLRHLTPQGILSVTHWIQFPARDNIKSFAIAIEALNRLHVSHPHKHLVFIRSWKTGTTLVKRSPFTPSEIDAVRRFCDERSFDVAYYPGVSPDETNRFNILSLPQGTGMSLVSYYEAFKNLLFGNERQFYRDYPFDIRPATDDRPFFSHFFRWKSLPQLRRIMGRQWAPWGYLLLIATLVQAALASLFLIVLPLLFLKRQGSPARKCRRFLYFLCLGLAFMFLEMSSMQKFVLFLRHPMYSIVVVISSFLVFSGLGSLFARKLIRPSSENRIRRLIPFAGIVILSLLYVAGLGGVFSLLSGMSTAARIITSVVLLAPVAFFMGMPFPLGLQNVSNSSPTLVPWCWGINGCASVLSTVLATTLAISCGFAIVAILAVVLYLIAAFVGT
jgi:spermidine synthase